MVQWKNKPKSFNVIDLREKTKIKGFITDSVKHAQSNRIPTTKFEKRK